jgi:integrase
MRHDYTLYKRYTDIKNKKGMIWYFYYYDENGIRRSRSAGTNKKYEAEDIAKEFVSPTNAKKHTLNSYSKTFFIWGECPWIKRQHAKGLSFSESVAAYRRSHLYNYILPKFGERALDSLNRVEIENWLINLKKKDTSLPLANQTKNHILYTFRIVLREAERERLIPVNCLGTVESLSSKGLTRDVFTKDELHLLFPDDLDKLITIWGRKEYAYLFYILATTGLRLGEIRALQWKHIIWNEQRNGLNIERAVKDNNEFGTTKTGHSRVILLTSRADSFLQDWLKEVTYDQMNDLIFYGSERHNPITRQTLHRHFEKALERVDIKVGNRCLVIHSFRHTYNTLLRPLVPKDVLQSMTGHRTDSMTDRYDHPELKISSVLSQYSKTIDLLFE